MKSIRYSLRRVLGLGQKTPVRHSLDRALRVFVDRYEEKKKQQQMRWITIGADDGEGGTPVQIDGDGKIAKGPGALAGKTIGEIDKGVKGTEKDRRGHNFNPETKRFDKAKQEEKPPESPPVKQQEKQEREPTKGVTRDIQSHNPKVKLSVEEKTATKLIDESKIGSISPPELGAAFRIATAQGNTVYLPSTAGKPGKPTIQKPSLDSANIGDGMMAIRRLSPGTFAINTFKVSGSTVYISGSPAYSYRATFKDGKWEVEDKSKPSEKPKTEKQTTIFGTTEDVKKDPEDEAPKKPKPKSTDKQSTLWMGLDDAPGQRNFIEDQEQEERDSNAPPLPKPQPQLKIETKDKSNPIPQSGNPSVGGEKPIFTLKTEGRRIYIDGPTYDYRNDIKDIGGKWDPDTKKWWVGSAKKEAIEKLSAKITSDKQKRREHVEQAKSAGHQVAIPFNAQDIREAAKRMGAVWNKDSKTWMFRDEDSAKKVSEMVSKHKGKQQVRGERGATDGQKRYLKSLIDRMDERDWFDLLDGAPGIRREDVDDISAKDASFWIDQIREVRGNSGGWGRYGLAADQAVMVERYSAAIAEACFATNGCDAEAYRSRYRWTVYGE